MLWRLNRTVTLTITNNLLLLQLQYSMFLAPAQVLIYGLDFIGAVGTLANGYVRSSPLPRLTPNRVPRVQTTRTAYTCKPLRHTGQTQARTHRPSTAWPHINSIAIRANYAIGNRSNRLIIV